VKFGGDSKYYQILNALYGLKTAPRDYQDATVTKLVGNLGFKRLHLCSCIYVKIDEENQHLVFIYDYVDDFICGGTDTATTLKYIGKFRTLANTTEPILNAEVLLGMEFSRDKEKRIICIRMEKKIKELCNKFPDAIKKQRSVPIPTTGYLVRDYEFEVLPEEKNRFLNQKEITVYMSIVGCLIWIQGIRLDIIFAVLYLSWNTRKPRQHHLDMAYYCIGYLNTTSNLPLVLGGKDTKIKITSFTDASLGTGPNGRSTVGEIHKLNSQSGAISAKATAGHGVMLSSFESELDGVTRAMKSMNRINNILFEIGIEHEKPGILYSDNKAMIEFVHGNSVAKGVRHMELRMWYTREQYKTGKFVLEFMPGDKIPTDKLTKLGTAAEHEIFSDDILGLSLLAS
jgi:hypothetical protein